MDKGRHGRGARRPLAGGSLFSRLIAAGGGRLRDIDRIGRGKAVLEALFERSLEPAFADFFPSRLALSSSSSSTTVCLGIAMDVLLASATHRSRHRANNARGMAGVPLPGIGDRLDQRPVTASDD